MKPGANAHGNDPKGWTESHFNVALNPKLAKGLKGMTG